MLNDYSKIIVDVGEFVCCEDIVNRLLLEFCNDAKFLSR